MEDNGFIQESYVYREGDTTSTPLSTSREKVGQESMDVEKPMHLLQQEWAPKSYLLEAPSIFMSKEGLKSYEINCEERNPCAGTSKWESRAHCSPPWSCSRRKITIGREPISLVV